MAIKTHLVLLALAAAMSAVGAAQATTIAADIVFAAPSILGGRNGWTDPNIAIPGFGNDGAPTAVVRPGVEFAVGELQEIFVDGPTFTIAGKSGLSAIDEADFAAASLSLFSGVGVNGAFAWEQTFTADTHGYFSGLSLVSDSYDGLTYSVAGDTLRVDWTGSQTVNQLNTYAADFSFAGGVPEPAAWTLLILGFGLMGGVLRRRSLSVSVA